jgi:allophanate hydrolase subunit 2
MSFRVIKKYGQVHKITRPTKLKKYGVPEGGPIDPFTPKLVRAALLQDESASLIEVMGTLVFEALRPMTICWQTANGGYVRYVNRFERVRVSCVGEFAGYLGISNQKLPDRVMEQLFQPVRQIRYLPIEYTGVFNATTTLNLSRQGFRFDCDLVADYEQKPSEPACQGLIQQTPNGQIIVLGPDGPVTGGYRKLGTVIEADWPYLGSMTYKEEYEFLPVNMGIAHDARTSIEEYIQKRCQIIRAIQAESATGVLARKSRIS